MPKNLIIVESPAKAKTIKNYLGKDFDVVASVGHIIDLPSKNLGVDIDNNFTPTYEIIPGKEKVVAGLKKAAKSADTIYLASDPDREGEAIAWHVKEAIDTKGKTVHRALFNEITKQGVADAIAHPVTVNMNKVDAQQSRRILDRIVGYQVSPLLWKPLKYGLSAGRVQSVALRMVCEREAEIEKFTAEESWTLEALFDVLLDSQKKGELKALLDKKNGKKFTLKKEQDADDVINELKKAAFKIESVEKKNVKSSAPQPFITARLQQDAIRKLGFKINRVMRVAQELYEGIDLGSGPEGLITYMRTDSTRISAEAAKSAAEYIKTKYGSQYLGSKKPSKKSSSVNVQDAHEAIRPTSVERTPENIKKYLNADQYKLYKLIWERFVASQMSDSLYEQTTVLISAESYQFRASGRVMTFAGYTVLYTEAKDEDSKDEDNPALINVDINHSLNPKDFEKNQHFTTPPPRFTEASIVKVLEQKGIGRPSTYASIISTIIDREYVEVKDKRMQPTELGRVVNTLLIKNFPQIFDEKFTALMEEGLDKIESGETKWLDLMSKFYKDFSNELSKAEKKFAVDLKVDMTCPECGKDLAIKYGKNGPFIACTSYPKCSFTSDYERDNEGKIIFVERKEPQATGIICEKCGKEMVIKKSRYGDMLACSGYPECKNIKNHIKLQDGTIKVINSGEKIAENCPVCHEGHVIVKSGRNGLFAACSNYPKCKYTGSIDTDESGNIVVKETPSENMGVCEKCGRNMIVKKSWRGPFLACSGYPECKNTKSIKSFQASKEQTETAEAKARKTTKKSTKTERIKKTAASAKKNTSKKNK